jgi:hypothetical protein
MKLGSWIMAVALALSVPASTALGDQLIMKDGKEYSGKLVRADANVVEFRIQGKVESFNISDVAQIVFKTPEIVSPPTGRSVSTPTPASIPRVSPSGNPPAERELQSSPAQGAQGTGTLPTVTLPAGTPITIRMAEDVDTERNQAGDVFNATLAEPLTLGDQVIAPAGSEIKGDVAYARDSGTFTGQSELILELNELRVGNRTYQLRTSDYSETGPSRGKRTAATIGGAAAVGAVIGGIIGGGKGAAIGAGTGAGVGTGVQVLTRGQRIKVPTETMLTFKLQSPLTIEVP